MRKTVIDVRGLACPEPLIAFTNAVKKADVTQVEIAFDCAAAKDNITRAAAAMGWKVVSVADSADHTTLNLEKAS
ncbi:sulfurtransferase TusA family protein [Desulfosarcina sp. OttesenSCG-928-A07]|nr:sulfurtransferase TusA family protein [Desulfosarcina sp. OttesenSCG-928-A07]